MVRSIFFSACILILAGIFFFFSILSAYIGTTSLNFIFKFGSYFFSRFMFAAFYIPAYLIFCGVYLLTKNFKKKIIFILITTLLPFLTLAMAFRVLSGTVSPANPFFSSFGTAGGMILILLSAIEILIILKIAFKTAQKPGRDIKNISQEQQPKNDPIPSSENRESLPSEEKETFINERPETPAYLRMKLSPLEDHMEKAEKSGCFFPEDEPAFFRQKRKAEEGAGLSEKKITYGSGSGNCSGAILSCDEEDTIKERTEETLPEDDEGDPEFTDEVQEEGKEIEDEDEKSGEDISLESVELPPAEKKEKKNTKYNIPIENILMDYKDDKSFVIDDEAKQDAEILRKTLSEFKIEAEITGIRKGPVITMFEILPAAGVNVTKISSLAGNIALRLAASRVRIVAPIPGKHAVGVEVPNKERSIVSFKDLIGSSSAVFEKAALPIVLGRDITGEAQIIDMAQTPHILIAGATGSGKSVCVNTIIASLLYKKRPDEVKMILIDPKIVELKLYNGIPHLLTPVITDPKRAFQALQYCICEMEKRYELLDALGVRDIKAFNKKIKTNKIATMPLPYIVIVVDEFADLMATSGKELESTLARLAAMSRAVGIHLVLATQRPSIDVITGLIKANIPSRIAFMVASKTDSRIIIDSAGAEMLLGKGDMLFTSAWNPYLIRIQGAYLSDDEVDKIVAEVKKFGEPEYIDDEIFIDDEEDQENEFLSSGGGDPLMDKALEIISATGKASASYLQRRLKIGYNRAARLIEEMEERGIVGPQNGSKARDILHIPDKYKE